MGIKLVRTPSDTPNITNNDDFVSIRYAYGNQNGYIKNKGTEIGYVVNGNTFKITSGRIVLDGVEIDIDANGVSLSVDNISTTRYYSIYLEVNLATNTSEIKSIYDTSSYPTISKGDDLTYNTSGTARVLLYQFESTSGTIGDVDKWIDPANYTSEQINEINLRLNDLGFKKGNVTNVSGGNIADYITLTKMGKYAILEISTGFTGSLNADVIAKLSFKAKNDINQSILGINDRIILLSIVGNYLTLHARGYNTYVSTFATVQIGFEITDW